jgi:hypothetical protein
MSDDGERYGKKLLWSNEIPPQCSSSITEKGHENPVRIAIVTAKFRARYRLHTGPQNVTITHPFGYK